MQGGGKVQAGPSGTTTPACGARGGRPTFAPFARFCAQPNMRARAAARDATHGGRASQEGRRQQRPARRDVREPGQDHQVPHRRGDGRLAPGAADAPT
eukprot:5109002-Prymnesium_polylepis.1